MNGNDRLNKSCPHCAAEHWGTEGDCSREALISLRNISVEWDGRAVLDDVSLVVRKGDFIAITGPNGGGKTTLLRIILGLMKPTKGNVHRNRTNLRIGYLPQKNMIDSHFPITVCDVIKSGMLALNKLSETERAKRYDEIINVVGLKQHEQKPIGVLSGGQLQRALLGRAIISRPELLILDEPLSYIDKRFEQRLYELIADLAVHTTIILVSHEMSTIAGMAGRHFIVDGSLRACSAHHHFVYTDCQT